MDSKKRLAKLGIEVPDILLPVEKINLNEWAVVACDQFTSEPDYWQRVERHVGDSPSTLKLIYPEVYLLHTDKEKRVRNINITMEQYQQDGLLRPVDQSFIYVRRTLPGGRTRCGLMMALDLDKYSYEKGADSLIRATEGTILDRLPPRIQIRENAPIELPHIMVLIDDKADKLFTMLADNITSLEKLYTVELMEGGGSISGYQVHGESMFEDIADLFEDLYADAAEQDIDAPLLFAMGDGNHSFATAKAIWEDLKKTTSSTDHPARWALVEIVNIYDKGLTFEPIHRLLIGSGVAELMQNTNKHPGIELEKTASYEEAAAAVSGGEEHRLAVVSKNFTGILRFTDPKQGLAVASLDTFIKSYTSTHSVIVDYIHGAENTRELASIAAGEEERIGFILPDFSKDQLFSTVIREGALPRKTFSMGEAREKRYYMEARKIIS